MRISTVSTIFTLLFLLLGFQFCEAQTDDNLILQTILQRYYKNEKQVYKGRSQLLYLYCNRANNNEELLEAIQNSELPNEFREQIRTKIGTDLAEQNWNEALESIYENDKTFLKQKINGCISLETYHEVSKRLNLNNQRLMIVSKPLYYSKKNIVLVKVVFYRNIEHNNGAVLLLEKVGANWIIKQYLNQWST